MVTKNTLMLTLGKKDSIFIKNDDSIHVKKIEEDERSITVLIWADIQDNGQYKDNIIGYYFSNIFGMKDYGHIILEQTKCKIYDELPPMACSLTLLESPIIAFKNFDNHYQSFLQYTENGDFLHYNFKSFKEEKDDNQQ